MSYTVWLNYVSYVLHFHFQSIKVTLGVQSFKSVLVHTSWVTSVSRTNGRTSGPVLLYSRSDRVIYQLSKIYLIMGRAGKRMQGIIRFGFPSCSSTVIPQRSK